MNAQQNFTKALVESDRSIANMMHDVMNEVEKLSENSSQLLAQRIQSGMVARDNFSRGKWHIELICHVAKPTFI